MTVKRENLRMMPRTVPGIYSAWAQSYGRRRRHHHRTIGTHDPGAT